MRKLANVFFEIMFVLVVILSVCLFFGWLYESKSQNLMLIWNWVTLVGLISALIFLLFGGNENR